MLKPEQQRELIYHLERETKKLKLLLKDVAFAKEAEEVKKLILSYYKDFKYFLALKENVKAFELANYIWGLLDALANLKLIKVPEAYKKWFKAEF